jgi:hypothetical protein
MRGLAVALLSAAAVALSAAPAHSTSCATEIEWNGETYSGMGDEQADRGRLLGTGVIPSCEGADEQVTVHAVRGVEPRFAVTGAGHERGFFVNTAYPVRLPQHPLHRLFFGHRRWPSCRPTRRVTVVGELESVLDVLRVDADRGPRALFVDDETRMAPRFGRLASGDRVRVAAVNCRFEGGPPIPFARRVTVVKRAPQEGADAGAIDPDVIVGAAITAGIFALGFGARWLQRRRYAASTR